jgi:hypothetical protein
LGPLGRRKPKVWAECLFADPIADIAVLGTPDNQELYEQAMAYEELTDATTPLKLGGSFPWETPTPIALIALDGRTITGVAQHLGDRLWIDKTSEPIAAGMSGSPVLDETGAAVGIISQSTIISGVDSGGMSPRLLAHLPGHMLIDLGAVKALYADQRFTRAHYRRLNEESRARWERAKSAPVRMIEEPEP